MRSEIATALKTLQLPSDDLVALRLTHYHPILNRILETFTVYGVRGQDHAWLWEGFKGEHYAISLPSPSTHDWLTHLVSSEERVWFFVEDWQGDKHDGNYWLFEGRIATIKAVLDELFHFEYYIVNKDLRWLLCETHHNVLIGVGQFMVDRLRVFQESQVKGFGPTPSSE